MSLSASEKVEVIRIVEDSELSIRQTVAELGISRTSFYRWYQRYQQGGIEALENRSKSAKRFWNKLPGSVKEQCLEIALQYPEKSPRELAWQITDEYKYFIFESSVYRILKDYDLITFRPIFCYRPVIRFIYRQNGSMSCGKLISPTSRS